jgi:RNA polymerase sigma factor (sigma-70 family)
MVNAQLGTVLRHLCGLAEARGTEGLSDAELLRCFSAGREEAAFAALMQRHGRLVWGVCRDVLRHEHDAEDAFQATFLVLARQAGSIHKGQAVAGWLHGTARRIALAARRMAARQRSHERRERSMPPEKSLSDEALREALGMLDDEVQRLPERQRAVFVLCCLEGKSRTEAARLLGWKEGTVAGTLARTRQRLRQRLVLRGVTLSSALCAVVLARQAKAAAPAVLVRSTVRAALSYAAGNGAASTVSKTVAALVKGATTMTTKLKTVTVLLLSLAIFATGLGALVYHEVGARPTEAPPAQSRQPQPNGPAKTAVPEAKEAEDLAVNGRVLSPEGKPVEGAKVFLVDDPNTMPLKAQAATSADGRFRFTLPVAQIRLPYYPDNRWDNVYMLAMADGFGPALVAVHDPAAAGERTLRLVPDDVPIKGRVLTLEGKPVVGAKVRIGHLSLPNKGDLTAWLEDLKGSKDGYPTENRHLKTLSGAFLTAIVPEITTDANGRFQIKGIGRERAVGLTISGPAIETRSVRVRTRPGETIQRLEWEDWPKSGSFTYFGATFDHHAGPTQVIVGVVRNKDTGKPLAGVRVQSEKLATSDLHGNAFLHTTTDKEGHYRLVGMPKGEGNLIKALGEKGQPYWGTVKGVPNDLGVEEATVDFELGRGVLIKGRVTDKLTSKPAAGADVEYFVFPDNPHLKNAPDAALHQRQFTGSDGSFQFIGLPGRGLVAAHGHGDRYAVGVGAEKYKDRDPVGHLPTKPPCLAIGFHTLVEVEPARDADVVPCEVVLDPGRTLHGNVLGPDGKPLAGAVVCGVKSYAFTYWEGEPLKTAEFAAFGFKDGRPRCLLFLHQEKKLAGSLLVNGEEKEPLRVRLEPWATVAGRLVTPDGLPDTDAELRFGMGDRFDDVTVGSHPTRGFRPDKEGKFRIEGLVPGLKYHLQIVKRGRIVGFVFKDFTIKSGETKELGDVKPGD